MTFEDILVLLTSSVELKSPSVTWVARHFVIFLAGQRTVILGFVDDFLCKSVVLD